MHMSIEHNMNAGIPQTAISVYQQDNAMDDFPVLKAFQQYIDAEQIKSRKRMVSLCVFFGVLMTIIVAVFMFMLHSISTRNQQLNDRLVEYAMRDRQPAVMPQAPAPQVSDANEAAMRAMTDTLVALQKQIAEQQQRPQQVFAAPVVQAPASPAPVVSALPEPTPEEVAIEQRTRAAEEKLRKARALLDAEKRKLAEERERLRQEEVERHRRRLYPEFYSEKKPNPQPQPQAQKPQQKISDEDIADILREVDEVSGSMSEDEDLDDDMEDAIEYFHDDDYEVPTEAKGTASKWHVPLD